MKILGFLLLINVTTFSFAKEKDAFEVDESYSSSSSTQKESLFDSVNLESIGVHATLDLTWEMIDDTKLSSIGFLGGLVSNSTTTLGLGYYSLATIYKPSGREMDISQLGLYTAYNPWSHKAFHPVFQLYVASGRISFPDDSDDFDSKNFISYTPSIHGELNLSSFLRVSLGLQYRIVEGLSKDAYPDLNQPLLSLRFSFGTD